MEVVYGLAAVLAGVDDEAVAAVEVVSAGRDCRLRQRAPRGGERRRAGASAQEAMWRLGMRRMWVGAWGWMSAKGEEVGGLVEALGRGLVPATILQKRQSGVGFRHGGNGTRAGWVRGEGCMMRDQLQSA